MRLIGYVRVRAVGGVVEGGGFGAQDRQIRTWAERHGHVVVRTVVDRCSTATPASGLAAAVRAVRAGEADAVLVASRSRLDLDEPAAVPILATDGPTPLAVAGPAEPRGRSRTKAGWVVTQWVAIAVAALVAHGVASAASVAPQPPIEARCASDRLEILPCDENQAARVLDIDPPVGCTAFRDSAPRQPNGIWLCLDDR